MPNAPYTTGNTFSYVFPQDPTPLDCLYPNGTFALINSTQWVWKLMSNATDAAVWEMFHNPNGNCRAWVNFNGTNASINDSFDITSVVRNGIGNYTITFTYAAPNANFAVVATAQGQGVTASILAQTTTTVQISTSTVVLGVITATDPTIVSVATFTSQ